MPPQLVAAQVSCPHIFPFYEVVVNTLEVVCPPCNVYACRRCAYHQPSAGINAQRASLGSLLGCFYGCVLHVTDVHHLERLTLLTSTVSVFLSQFPVPGTRNLWVTASCLETTNSVPMPVSTAHCITSYSHWLFCGCLPCSSNVHPHRH